MQKYPFKNNTKKVVLAAVPPGVNYAAHGTSLRIAPGAAVRSAIYIRQGTVASVQPVPEGAPFIPEKGWSLLELPADWLLIPALVDCHVHLVLDSVQGFKALHGPVPRRLLADRLEKLVNAGVLAVRDGGDRYNSALHYDLQRTESNCRPVPLIVATGPAIHRRGHYGLKLGDGGISDHHQAVAKIRQLKKMGARQVKVVLSGLVNLDTPGLVGPVQFTEEELTFLVRTARDEGLPVMVHASSDSAVQTALAAGVHTVEHGYYLSADSLQKMAAQNTAWIPTVAPMAALAERLQRLGDFKRAVVARQAVEQHLEMIARAHACGVTLGIGTDAGSPGVSWEKGYFQEMKYYARAGLSAGAILKIATKNGAMLLGKEEHLGDIAPGKRPFWLAVTPEFFTFQSPETTLRAVFWAE